jgi:hypothetical protein
MRILSSISVAFLFVAFGAAWGTPPSARADGWQVEGLSAAEESRPPVPEDPRDGAVRLQAPEGWNAYLVIDNDGVGIWTVDSFKVFPQLGAPEVVGLDDLGRCIVLVSYSGRWTPYLTIHDGKWLGGMAHGDVDPRIDGSETYVGGQRGNIFQVVGYSHSTLDNRLIAHLEGREIHTLLAGDLVPSSPGKELLVFTRPGGLFRLTPTGPDGTWELEHLGELPGRVRDAVVLPSASGTTPQIATVSRTGRLELLRMTGEGAEWTLLHQAPMGRGRIALRRSEPGDPAVLYSTLDDGRVLRHRHQTSDGWKTETIYLGPQGPRGIAAGRFHEDPQVETVAVFGYSGKVQILSRQGQEWKVETIFQDRDKGHWLATAELDGRNSTHELLASGYGARIVLLSRPPGYGRPEALDPE